MADPGERLLDACERGDLTLVRQLVKEVDAKTYRATADLDWSPLEKACRYVIKFLFLCPAKVGVVK